MKLLLTVLAVVCLMQLTTGCGLLPAKQVDGSQSFYEAHPEYANQPGYMQNGGQNDDDK